MKVEVLLFASLRDAIGEASVMVQASEGMSVSEVARLLFEQRGVARLGGLPVRFAVDETFVSDAHVLRDGDRVAIIPPVSGG